MKVLENSNALQNLLTAWMIGIPVLKMEWQHILPFLQQSLN
jgi:hypothetical protein